MNEKWADVVGYEDYFQVSTFGNVYSKRTHKILKTNINKKGYVCFSTKIGGRDTPPILMRIHRLVATAFIKNNENKPFVNHIDGNKRNNHVENLEWVTAKENTIHAVEIGLIQIKHGDENGMSKFSNETVVEIRALYKTGMYTHRKLAELYEVDHRTIGRICTKESYDCVG